jgi:hypothetical protein
MSDRIEIANWIKPPSPNRRNGGEGGKGSGSGGSRDRGHAAGDFRSADSPATPRMRKRPGPASSAL